MFVLMWTEVTVTGTVTGNFVPNPSNKFITSASAKVASVFSVSFYQRSSEYKAESTFFLEN